RTSNASKPSGATRCRAFTSRDRDRSTRSSPAPVSTFGLLLLRRHSGAAAASAFRAVGTPGPGLGFPDVDAGNEFGVSEENLVPESPDEVAEQERSSGTV